MSGSTPNLKDAVKRVKDIEDGLIYVAKAMKDLENSRLSEKAIITLLHDSTGVPKKTIAKVISGMTGLEETYLKKQEKEK